MRYRIATTGSDPRRGVALIAVLVVVAVLGLAAYRFSDLMQGEQQAAESYRRSVQARTLADSGINYIAAALASDANGQTSILGGNPYNNTALQAFLVHDDDNPRLRGRFSLVSPL